EGAKPVRIGNAAYQQFQLDISGEFAIILYEGALHLKELSPRVATVFKKVAVAVSRSWTRPDRGIWEVRGPDRAFTASKVAAWVAMASWVKVIERFNPPGEDPAEWRALRQAIHDEVCTLGYDSSRNTFTQYYGSNSLDASLLLIPLTGFLAPADPRVVGTVQA